MAPGRPSGRHYRKVVEAEIFVCGMLIVIVVSTGYSEGVPLLLEDVERQAAARGEQYQQLDHGGLHGPHYAWGEGRALGAAAGFGPKAP